MAGLQAEPALTQILLKESKAVASHIQSRYSDLSLFSPVREKFNTSGQWPAMARHLAVCVSLHALQFECYLYTSPCWGYLKDARPAINFFPSNNKQSISSQPSRPNIGQEGLQVTAATTKNLLLHSSSDFSSLRVSSLISASCTFPCCRR